MVLQKLHVWERVEFHTLPFPDYSYYKKNFFLKSLKWLSAFSGSRLNLLENNIVMERIPNQYLNMILVSRWATFS